MNISKYELKQNKRLWNGWYSEGYLLDNGLIAKMYCNMPKELLDLNIQKIILGRKYQWIKNLAAPIDELVTEDGISGYVMQRKDGKPFPDYVNNIPEGPTLSEVIDYIVKLEKILKLCHEEGLYFPDLASGNALYNSSSKEVNIIDYDGAQVGSLLTYDISSVIGNLYKDLMDEPKYYKNKMYNKNIDIFTLGVRFFYYATKIDISKNLRKGSTLDQIIETSGITNTYFAELLHILFDRKKDNVYLSDALEDLNEHYTLSKKIMGVPRIFIKK